MEDVLFQVRDGLGQGNDLRFDPGPPALCGKTATGILNGQVQALGFSGKLEFIKIDKRPDYPESRSVLPG